MAEVKIAALDGSLRNFGVVKGTYDTNDEHLTIGEMHILKTEKSKNKQVRASSDNLTRAQSIAERLRPLLDDCAVVFLEVPSGGQSYSAVLGFGIVIGIYASLTIPVVEVSPSETKLAAVGTKTASKQEMIEWATQKFPQADWRKRKLHGKFVITNDNEHLADSVGIMHAGIQTPSFRQTIAMMKAAKPS